MLAWNKLLQRHWKGSYWCQWFMGLPCLYQSELKWKGKPYPLSEKRACRGFMEPNLGARKATKYVWKLQAEPQKLSRANYHAKLISARTRWTHKWSSKRRFSAIQEGNAYQPYNGDLQNKVSFDIQPTNPQADITATGHCEYWITGSQPLISWIIK